MTDTVFLRDSKPTVWKSIGHPLKLASMQKFVGGYITVLHLDLTYPTAAGALAGIDHYPQQADLVVNEDGDHLKLRYNVLASHIAGQKIFGNAILLLDKAKVG